MREHGKKYRAALAVPENAIGRDAGGRDGHDSPRVSTTGRPDQFNTCSASQC